jgi:hypothetical protein
VVAAIALRMMPAPTPSFSEVEIFASRSR